MALADDIELLARVELFQGFSTDQLRLMAFGADRENFAMGHEIYKEGDDSRGGYIVVRGQIDLTVLRDGSDIVLDSCFEGALVGELALITANQRVSNAVARVDSEALVIQRSLFHRMLREYPEIAALLYRRITQSVRRMIGELNKVQDRMVAIPSLHPKRKSSSKTDELGDA